MARARNVPARAAEGSPAECPRGHVMRAGQTIVGWSPCQCPPCLGAGADGATVSRPSARGHRTYLCWACHDEGYTTMAYFPYHVKAENAAVRWP
jgi:hypothetical protein